MYSYEVLPHLKKILKKISRKDNKLYERILKKIEGVITSFDIEHYKNLRYNLKDRKRVQIGHFVLVFKYIKSEDKIIFVDFEHHDNIYIKDN